jgi:protein-S-isoprenylcysteine O-methyltransferase Ste14
LSARSAYAIGFVSQFVVPKTIDSGAASAPLRACIVDLALMSLFAIQHSGMARRGFKRLFASFASPAVERSTYVLLASLTLDAAVLAVAADHDRGLADRNACACLCRNCRRLRRLAYRALQHIPDQPF